MQFLSVHNTHFYLIPLFAQKPGTAAIVTVTLQVLSCWFKNHLIVFGESCCPYGDEQRTGLLHKPLLLQTDGSNPEMMEAAVSAGSALKPLRLPLLHLSLGLQTKLLVMESALVHFWSSEHFWAEWLWVRLLTGNRHWSFWKQLAGSVCLNDKKIDLGINFLNCIVHP